MISEKLYMKCTEGCLGDLNEIMIAILKEQEMWNSCEIRVGERK